MGRACGKMIAVKAVERSFPWLEGKGKKCLHTVLLAAEMGETYISQSCILFKAYIRILVSDDCSSDHRAWYRKHVDRVAFFAGEPGGAVYFLKLMKRMADGDYMSSKKTRGFMGRKGRKREGC